MANILTTTIFTCGIVCMCLVAPVINTPPGSAECGCMNGGLCDENNKCYCLPGYTGNTCDDDLSSADPCDDHDCEAPKACIHRAGTADCTWCTNGTSGEDCTRVLAECLSGGRCTGGGTCVDVSEGTSRCQCPSQRTGPHCETDMSVAVDPCAANPCESGRTCMANGTSYTCTCPPGKGKENGNGKGKGTADCNTVDPCSSNPCQMGGTCIKDDNGSYTCNCTTNSTGRNCETMPDPCLPWPCQNGGSCAREDAGTYRCNCTDGWTGTRCETASDMSVAVDPCAANPCESGRTCMANGTSYTCTCPPGKGKGNGNGQGKGTADCNKAGGEGRNCPDTPCPGGLQCVTDGVGETKCHTVMEGNCTVHNCRNGGLATCVDPLVEGGQAFICTCAEGYHGHQCENRKRFCKPGTCRGRGACTEGPASFRCGCQPPYRGKACDKEPRSLVFTMKLNLLCRPEDITNITTLRTRTSNLTQKIMKRLCRPSNGRDCTSLQLEVLGASCGSLDVHYELQVQNVTMITEVKADVGELVNSEDIRKAGVIGMPVIIVAYEETVVIRVTPSRGPREGGTTVTIVGDGLDLGQNTVVQFGDHNCSIVSRSATVVKCRTSPLSDTSLLRTPLKLNIGVQGGNFTEQSVGEFTYRPTPVIDTIHPLRTIIGGGLLVTVNGSDLDTASPPRVLISVNNTENGQTCITANKTHIVCATPPVDPDEARARHVSGAPSRRRREANHSGRATGTFMIGLDLDGLLFYPEEIPVYVNPMLFPFNETDHAKSTITYRTYSPRSEDYIEIEGSGLGNGLTANDYTVSIGQSAEIDCPITVVSNTTIRCTPNGGSGTQPLRVRIGVQPMDTLIGYVRFENSAWDNPGFKAGIISGVIVVVTILMCAAGFCIYTHVQQTRREHAASRRKDSDRTIVRNYNSRYDKTRNRSIKKRISDFISPSKSTRVMRQPKDVMSFQHQSSNSDTDNSFASYASTIEAMPNHSRFSPSYNQGEPEASSGNFFLNNFNKFVSNKWTMRNEGIYDEIGLRESGISFDEETFTVGISPQQAEAMRRCSRDHLLGDSDNPFFKRPSGGAQDLYLQPTGGSLHPPGKGQGGLGRETHGC